MQLTAYDTKKITNVKFEKKESMFLWMYGPIGLTKEAAYIEDRETNVQRIFKVDI